jgi:hypothetical protein
MIEIARSHPYSHGAKGFQISPLMQEKMVFAGQYDNYGSCNKLIETFLNRQVSTSQVLRVTNAYGQEFDLESQSKRTLALPVKQEAVYAMVDGSMILSRQGWKETKLGRVFKSGDCMKDGTGKGSILPSQYVAHLGSNKLFCRAMSELLDSYGGNSLGEQLVLINDGAAWIHQWCKDIYPQAVHVLDYYHAAEHLYEFVALAFKDSEAGKQWGKSIETLFMQSKIEQAIAAIQQQPAGNKKAQDVKTGLINYYQQNKSRMDYACYLKIGNGIIGSGAIESAHRTVIQKRLKQSGQRWSITGAQNVLNLRVVYMSSQWYKVINLIKSEQCAAATKNNRAA